jgi:hypothetical protein
VHQGGPPGWQWWKPGELWPWWLRHELITSHICGQGLIAGSQKYGC